MSTPTHVRVLRNAPVQTHWSNARAQFAHAIEHAATQALAQSGQTFAAPASAVHVVTVLTDAIVCRVFDGAVTDLTLYAWTPHAPSMLSALRHELLCGRSRSEWSDVELLPAISAIETLNEALRRDATVQFAHQFSGVEAQQRVIEMAHDMRSPLNAILLLVERMQHGQSGPVTTTQRNDLALVYSAAFGLTSMANDLMDVARGGARLLAEPPHAFSISALLRSVRDVVQPVAAERRLSLRFSGPPADIRFGQESALQRVLLNLTTNALKFTTIGSVTVDVQQGRHADELLFAVEDTGRGISPAHLDEIFAAISPSASVKPESFSADGLGLAICRKLVTAMRGELKVESRADHGTRFTFSLQLPTVETSMAD